MNKKYNETIAKAMLEDFLRKKYNPIIIGFIVFMGALFGVFAMLMSQPVEEANKRIMCELTPNQIKELSNEEYRECSIQRQMEREKHGDIIYRD